MLNKNEIKWAVEINVSQDNQTTYYFIYKMCHNPYLCLLSNITWFDEPVYVNKPTLLSLLPGP